MVIVTSFLHNSHYVFFSKCDGQITKNYFLPSLTNKPVENTKGWKEMAKLVSFHIRPWHPQITVIPLEKFSLPLLSFSQLKCIEWIFTTFFYKFLKLKVPKHVDISLGYFINFWNECTANHPSYQCSAVFYSTEISCAITYTNIWKRIFSAKNSIAETLT